MTGPELVYGGAFGDPSASWVEARCRECPWTSGEYRSRGEALAVHQAHQREAHPDRLAGGWLVSDLLNVRVIAAPPAAARAVDRLAEVLDLDCRDGPYPSRKSPELVRYYLTGRLQPTITATFRAGQSDGWLCSALAQICGDIAAALADETADRQYALEQADSSLTLLIARCRASTDRVERS
jgi:hypothetical protein